MPRSAATITTQPAPPGMTPQAFIATWGPGGPASGLNEEQGAQQPLPRAVRTCSGVPAPARRRAGLRVRDRALAFTRATRASASGYADVLQARRTSRGRTRRRASTLDAALRQLHDLTALALDNPPLLVVCGPPTASSIHTQFNGHAAARRHAVAARPTSASARQARAAAPLYRRPSAFARRTTANRDITEEAAKAFADVAERHASRAPRTAGARRSLPHAVLVLLLRGRRWLVA